RDAAWAAPPAVPRVRAAVGDIELGPITARVEAVRANAGRDEADLLERIAIHHEDAIGHHVGDVEDLAVRRDPDVLRHSAATESGIGWAGIPGRQILD